MLHTRITCSAKSLAPVTGMHRSFFDRKARRFLQNSPLTPVSPVKTHSATSQPASLDTRNLSYRCAVRVLEGDAQIQRRVRNAGWRYATDPRVVASPAPSPPISPSAPHIQRDRALRQCQLGDALDAAKELRQRFATLGLHRSQQPVAPARSPRLSFTATLADLSSKEKVGIVLKGSDIQSAALACASSPNTHCSHGTVPAKERHALIQYAILLHAVFVAAVRVASTDYHRFYASRVREELVGRSRNRLEDIHVPRTTRWQDSDDTHHVLGSREGRDNEEAIFQAEQRLGYWAVQWYKQIEEQHSPPGMRVGHQVDGPGCAKGPPQNEKVQYDSERQDWVANLQSEEASLVSLLLQGNWRAALDCLTRLPIDAAAEQRLSSTQPSSSCSTPPVLRIRSCEMRHAPLSELFSAVALHHRQRVLWRDSASKSRQVCPPLPQRLALAPVTETELRLLRNPPSQGMQIIPTSGRSDTPRLDHGNSVKPGCLAPAHRGDSCATSSQGVEGAVGELMASTVRLRKRVWILQHMPRHFPASLVRFKSSHKNRKWRSDPAVSRDVAMPHPYLLRCPALEKLPWYPLCILSQALAMTVTTSTGFDDPVSLSACRCGIAKLLSDARAHSRAALFFTVPGDYAALHDYVHSLFITLGSGMVAHEVAKRHCGDTAVDAVTAAKLEGTFAKVAIALLRPPPENLYDAVGLKARWANIDAAGEESPAMESKDVPISLSATHDNDISTLHTVTHELLVDLCTAVQDWRNYHLSLYCETLSQICDGDGTALIAVLRVLSPGSVPAWKGSRVGRERHSNLFTHILSDADDEDESPLTEQPVVLAPESAVAVVTAVVLQCLGQQAPWPSSGVVSSASSSGAFDRFSDKHNRIPFANVYVAVPCNKKHGMASYFKGIFHPSFFKRVVSGSRGVAAKHEQMCFCDDLNTRGGGGDATANAVNAGPSSKSSRSMTAPPLISHAPPTLTLPPEEWEGNPAARLVGRSLRRVERYPTSTTEAFFPRYVRGDDLRNRHTNNLAIDKRLAGAKPSPHRSTYSATIAPPLLIDIYVVDISAAIAYWLECRGDAGRGKEVINSSGLEKAARPSGSALVSEIRSPDVTSATVNVTNTHVTPVELWGSSDNSRPATTSMGEGTDNVVLLATPSTLPYGLHAVCKSADVNCTLHSHYPSLVFPFLSRHLPWSAMTGKGCGDPVPPSRCVPAYRQQGLVNRIDVGTSGIVLVARQAAAMYRAVDAMREGHHIRKTYRALVQRWPPLAPMRTSRYRDLPTGNGSSDDDPHAAPLFTCSPFLSPLQGVVSVPVFAAGATSATLRGCRHQGYAPEAAPLATDTTCRSFGVSPPVSPFPAIPDAETISYVHQNYSTLHAALRDQRNATTHYRVLESFASVGVMYVQVELSNGHRHQIRQHFAQLGFPLVGDSRYHPGVASGKSGTTFSMQRAALHAFSVDLLVGDDESTEGERSTCPSDEPGRVIVQAPLSKDMQRALGILRRVERSACGVQQ